MKLDQLNVPSNVITNLAKNGWTVQRLATATPKQLSVIPGIGMTTAKNVIEAAKDIVNQELLLVSAEPEYNPAPPEPTQRSVRVRRIYGEKI